MPCSAPLADRSLRARRRTARGKPTPCAPSTWWAPPRSPRSRTIRARGGTRSPPPRRPSKRTSASKISSSSERNVIAWRALPRTSPMLHSPPYERASPASHSSRSSARSVQGNSQTPASSSLRSEFRTRRKRSARRATATTRRCSTPGRRGARTGSSSTRPLERAAQSIEQRTDQTARTTRQADQGAELHQRLVGVARGVANEQPRRRLAHQALGSALRGIDVEREQARDHALDVAVDHRHRLAEGDARDRRRGVGADAGQLEQLRLGAREIAALDDRARRRVQSSRTRVVAEPRPLREHLLDRRRGQRLDVGKRGDESFVIRQHGLDPRLLQHDLGDQHAIRIAALAPRQRAPIRAIPREQSARRGPRVVVERDHRRALDGAKIFLARESVLINETSALARKIFFSFALRTQKRDVMIRSLPRDGRQNLKKKVVLVSTGCGFPEEMCVQADER